MVKVEVVEAKVQVVKLKIIELQKYRIIMMQY